MKRRAVVVIRQEDNTKNPSKAVTSIDTVVRLFLSTTTRSRVLPWEASVPISRSLGKHVCSWSWSQDVWTTINARFLGFHVQSLSARGLEARRGSGLLACAGSPKEAQRRSRSGWGGVWAMFWLIFQVPDAFLRRPAEYLSRGRGVPRLQRRTDTVEWEAW